MAKKTKMKAPRIDDRFAKKTEMQLMQSNDARDRIAGVGRLIHGRGNWISPMARDIGIARQTLVDWLIDEDRHKNIWITIDESLLTIIMRAAEAMQQEMLQRSKLFTAAEKTIAARTTTNGSES